MCPIANKSFLELSMSILERFAKLQDDYEQLCRLIIRPARSPYPLSQLGPEEFKLEGTKVKRIDFELTNSRGYVFFCSHFVPLGLNTHPCVVYTHGNSSNRTEGMEYLGKLIRQGISLCTFDFSGCGNAEGQYVTLGYYEQEDLQHVVDYLRSTDTVTEIALWGRSMGAVAALLYLKNDPNICAAVFDSAFKSLKSLAEDLCKKESKVLSLVVGVALGVIAKSIESRAKFSLYKINPVKNEVPFLHVPAMFVVASADSIVPADHTSALYDAYVCTDKHIQVVKGGHNDPRPEECVAEIIKFIKGHFQAGKNKRNEDTVRQSDNFSTLKLKSAEANTFTPNQQRQLKEPFSFKRMLATVFTMKEESEGDSCDYSATRKQVAKHLKVQCSKQCEQQRRQREAQREKGRHEAALDDSIVRQIELNMAQWAYY